MPERNKAKRALRSSHKLTNWHRLCTLRLSGQCNSFGKLETMRNNVARCYLRVLAPEALDSGS